MPKKNIILIIQIACVYIGAMVGAGFASGQEVYKFFTVYGIKGIIGSILSGVLFGMFGMSIIHTSSIHGFDSYIQYLRYLFGNSFTTVIDILVSLSLYIGLTVMLIGSSSFCVQIWGVSTREGFIISAGVLYLLLLLGIEGFLWFNTLIIPFLILISMLVSVVAIFEACNINSVMIYKIDLIGGNWLYAALLYVSYNLIIGIVVLSTIGKKAGNSGIYGALIGGLTLGAMTCVISYVMILYDNVLCEADMPLLQLAYHINPIVGRCYSFVLLAAIVTTALSDGIGLLKRLEKIIYLPKYILLGFIFLPTLFFINFSFKAAVGLMYPIMGYAGFLLLTAIIIKHIKDYIQIKKVWFK